MTPSPEARWRRLRGELSAWKKYPKNAMAALRAERENFQPLMLAELGALAEDPDRLKGNADYFMHIHLLALLAEWREAAAWPLLLQFFRRLDEERYNAIYEPEDGEYLIPLIATLMPAGTTPLDEVQALLGTPEVSSWLRVDVLEALWLRVEKDILPREELIPRLRQALAVERAFQLSIAPEARDNVLLTMTLVSLAKLGDAQSIPLVQPLFDEGLLDPQYLGDTVEDYAVYMRGEKVWSENYPRYWVDDATVFVKSFFYQPQTRQTSPPEDVPPDKAVSPKPGRNDPCPCGSGKKYKKCCGA
ncbi:MAG: DUF1186 domain-containing protein [Candidatus Accumulibacter sp.]|jgi:hypothetical protein|nr:DUF1186 domain-containing protein [Accumulibacter sp.]